jgi:hypothetical protein
VRATQFHDFLAALFGPARATAPSPRRAASHNRSTSTSLPDSSLRSRWDHPAATASRSPARAWGSIPALARAWKTARRSRAVVLPVPLPSAIGHRVRAGALTNQGAQHRGRITFEGWL